MTEQERRHQEKVTAMADQVQALAGEGRRAYVAKGGVSHFVPLPGDHRFRGRAINIKGLNELLSIDPQGQTCVAEPGLTFSELAQATLAHGLLPMVVPELKGITLGGAVAGCSVESMSYRYGGFHDSCLEYELISGTGEVIRCSPEEPELFEMVHGSYGTLAILTKLRFRLIPVKPFVRMRYLKFKTFSSFQRELMTLCSTGTYPFVDAIIHGPHSFVVCVGEMVDRAPYVSDYTWLNVFYRSTLEREEDYLSTYDYCFRYDTECHWMTRTVPLLENNKLARLLLGKLVLGSTNLISLSNRLERILALKKRPDVVCDVFLPAGAFEEFFRWYQADFRFYPLWVIPYRMPQPYLWLDPAYVEGFGGDLFIDCAVYGKPNNEPHCDYSELLEKEILSLNGIKTLISRNHFTREEFWRVYNRAAYDNAKERLDPEGLFPNVYDKFHPLGGA